MGPPQDPPGARPVWGRNLGEIGHYFCCWSRRRIFIRQVPNSKKNGQDRLKADPKSRRLLLVGLGARPL